VETLIDKNIRKIYEDKQEIVPLSETKRGTLDESHTTILEEKHKMDPKSPNDTK
jgi:hypothetical protein